MAFKLADFLAIDPEYTAMLGRAGFLASGKSDYGTDAVVASLIRDEGDVRDTAFSVKLSARPSIRGVDTPDLERWPVIEDPSVPDRLQGVWRRMAKGDVVGVRQEAKEVDWVVNSQVYLPSRALNALIQSWRWDALIFSTATFLLVLAGLHRRRLQQVERQFNMRLEERLNERTRIARDLHDTLLQSFNALLLHLQTVSNVLPASPDEAKRRIDSAIEQASEAIAEGRDAVHELRSGAVAAMDLDEAISSFAKELSSGSGTESAPAIHIEVHGKPRLLDPGLRDEVFRIAAEALRNAIRHAHAGRIEVEIRYDEDQLGLRIRDDGKGINPVVLGDGRSLGHWGLRGMQERAKLAGGALEVWSQVAAGTEIAVNIPATSIYTKPASARWKFSRFKARLKVVDMESRPIRILAADDHPVFRSGIASLLADHQDMTLVAEASSGLEAVRQFRAHKPDITLMDLQMPEMSGLDAIISIRGEFSEAKIIVLATYSGDVQVFRALKAGAHAYLLKNTLHRDLVDTIRAVNAGKKALSPEASFELAEHATDDALTPGEVNVLRLIAAGNANKQIAEQLSVTEETVKGRVKNILSKLNANDRTHAATIGLKRGIIEL